MRAIGSALVRAFRSGSDETMQLVYRPGLGVRYSPACSSGKFSTFPSAIVLRDIAIPVIAMLSSKCLFCGRVNPGDAKFCNDCASPLHLKPCHECDAINDRSTQSCYKCGADFPVQIATTQEGPATLESQAPSGRSRVGEFQRDPGLSLGSEGTLFDRDPGLPPTSAEGTIEAHARRLRREAKQAPAHEVEVIARERPPGGRITRLFPAVERATQVVPVLIRETKSGRSRVARAALSTLLVIAVALSGYFVYRSSTQPGDRLQATQSNPSNADAVRTPSSVGVPPNSPASIGRGASGVAIGGSTGTGAPVAPQTDEAASPVRQGRIRTSVPDRLDGETRSPAESAAAALSPSTVTNVAPAQSLAVPVDPEAKARRTATGTAPKGDGKTVTPGSRPATKAESNRSTMAYPNPAALGAVRPRASDVRGISVPGRERPGTCTEGVAALGLCEQRPGAEGK